MCFYSGKVVIFEQSGCIRNKSGFIRAEVVVFGQKWLNLGKEVVFRQIVCDRKLVVFGQKVIVLGQSVYTWAKWL